MFEPEKGFWEPEETRISCVEITAHPKFERQRIFPFFAFKLQLSRGCIFSNDDFGQIRTHDLSANLRLLSPLDHAGRTLLLRAIVQLYLNTNVARTKLTPPPPAVFPVIDDNTTSAVHAFDLVADSMLKENFAVFARNLFGQNAYKEQLAALSPGGRQCNRTRALLENWLTWERQRGHEPVIRDIVRALSNSRMQRTASEVEKLEPCPR